MQMGTSQAASDWPSPVPPMKLVPYPIPTSDSQYGILLVCGNVAIGVRTVGHHDSECDGQLLQSDQGTSDLRRCQFGVIPVQSQYALNTRRPA